MLKQMITTTANFKKCATNFCQNNDGVAAIEFAFVAPVMIALYLGLSEVSLLISADRDVSHAASVTGDLAAQEETLTKADIQDIFTASLAVMGTTKTQSKNVSMDIISFEMDSSGNIQEVGYAKLGSGLSGKFNATGTSKTLLNKTSGLVVTRISYKYVSPSQTFVKSPKLKETFMLKPRKSKSIPFNGGATVTCSINTAGNKAKASC